MQVGFPNRARNLLQTAFIFSPHFSYQLISIAFITRTYMHRALSARQRLGNVESFSHAAFVCSLFKSPRLFANPITESLKASQNNKILFVEQTKQTTYPRLPHLYRQELRSFSL